MKEVFAVSAKEHAIGATQTCWAPNSALCATVGSNGSVYVTDRHGVRVGNFHVSGQVVDLGFDASSEVLAVITDGSRSVKMWNANTRTPSELETKMKGLSLMTWASGGSLLAIGTVKGNLLLVNYAKGRLVPIVGKHTRAITAGAWSADGVLALAAEDRQVTLSSHEGETLDSMLFGSLPRLLAWGCAPSSATTSSSSSSPVIEPSLAVVVGESTLIIRQIHPSEGFVSDPHEMVFDPKDGPIVDIAWKADGVLLIGFGRGRLLALNARSSPPGKEVFSKQVHASSLASLAYCPRSGEIATCGDDSVVVLSSSSWTVSHSVQAAKWTSHLLSLTWAPNGQFLTLATDRGDAITFLTTVPVIGAAYATLLVSLASLRELLLVQTHVASGHPVSGVQDADAVASGALFLPGPRLDLDSEPSFLGLGPAHVAAGHNNVVHYYDWADGPPTLVLSREYVTSVDALSLSDDVVAVLAGSRITLHSLESATAASVAVPPSNEPANVTAVALVNSFLMYGTRTGVFSVLLVEDADDSGGLREPVQIASHTFPSEVVGVYPNANGTRIFIQDAGGLAVIYNPVNDTVVSVPDVPVGASGALWDQNVLDDLDGVQDWGVFVVFNADVAVTYAYFPLTVQGASVEKVAVTHLPRGHVPMLLRSGEMVTLSGSGQPAKLVLESHGAVGGTESGVGDSAEPLEAFEQNLALGRLGAAWRAAVLLDNVQVWNELGSVALAQLDVELATQAYRQIGDAGMVMSLEGILDVEDRNLLGGYVAMFFGDYDRAQALFLASTKPKVALDMRRDLLDWDAALQLATSLSPSAVPAICKEYAQQLEFRGEYESALSMFTRASKGSDKDGAEAHASACTAGIARCTLRMGDLTRGMALVLNSNSTALAREAGAILESMKLYADAARAYEAGKIYDKAVDMYLATKAYDAAGALMGHVKNPALHLKYAKAMEALERYPEAEVAYEAAKDWVGVIRVNLGKLNNPSKVLALVRSTKSVEGAMLVAEHCRKVGDFTSAIEFLLLAECREEAFNLADREGAMDTFASLIGEQGSETEFREIAKYYTATGALQSAGDYYAKAGDSRAATKAYLEANTEDALLAVIEYVGTLNDDVLIHMVIDNLSGASGGEPKDPKYIYWLYSALGNFDKVAEVALRIASNEQDLGNYREAHLILHDAAVLLRSKGISVPHSLSQGLMLVHSYLLVKSLAKIDSTRERGARMLVRVANSISRFPAHVVPILTSTVLECYKSGLKRSAFEYASMLMRPEYRPKLNDKYRKRIESIVRRPDKSQAEEEASPCPICDAPVPNSDLDCLSCRSALPFCVMTGTHLVLEGLCVCPSCGFGAHKSIVSRGLVANGGVCPMCSGESEGGDWRVLGLQEARDWVDGWVA